MKMSDIIAEFIGDMLISGGGVAEIQRREIADRFSCVPSQINYVIETRFSPENGYMVESRRGGGGYIRIMRRMSEDENIIINIINRIGEELSFKDAAALSGYLVKCEAISQKQAKILLGTCNDNALKRLDKNDRNKLRVDVFKYGLLAVVSD